MVARIQSPGTGRPKQSNHSSTADGSQSIDIHTHAHTPTHTHTHTHYTHTHTHYTRTHTRTRTRTHTHTHARSCLCPAERVEDAEDLAEAPRRVLRQRHWAAAAGTTRRRCPPVCVHGGWRVGGVKASSIGCYKRPVSGRRGLRRRRALPSSWQRIKAPVGTCDEAPKGRTSIVWRQSGRRCNANGANKRRATNLDDANPEATGYSTDRQGTSPAHLRAASLVVMAA